MFLLEILMGPPNGGIKQGWGWKNKPFSNFKHQALFELYLSCVLSCTVLCVSIGQVIGCEDRLRNDPDCVGRGVKLYSNSWLLEEKEHNCSVLFSVI